MAVGGIPDAQESLVRRLPRPWKPEEISELKARVPFCPNGWNTCSKALNSFGAAVCFIFVLALSAPQVRNIFGLEEATALTLSLSLLVVALIFVVVAEWKKAWPPRWVSRSLDIFFSAHPEITATQEFLSFVSSLPADDGTDVPLWLRYKIEWCDKMPIIIVWRRRIKRTRTKIEFDGMDPVAVFDTLAKKLIDPATI